MHPSAYIVRYRSYQSFVRKVETCKLQHAYISKFAIILCQLEQVNQLFIIIFQCNHEIPSNVVQLCCEDLLIQYSIYYCLNYNKSITYDIHDYVYSIKHCLNSSLHTCKLLSNK